MEIKGRKIVLKKLTIVGVGNFFLALHIILVGVVRLYINTTILLAISTISLLISGIIGFFFAAQNKEIRMFLYGFFMVLSWLYIYILRTSWRYELSDIIESVCYLGASYLLICNEFDERFYSFIYYLVSSYIFWELIVRHTPIRGFMKDGTSYNYISIIVLFYLTILNIVRLKKEVQIRILDLMLLIIISLAAYGRGGILASFIYLGLYILYRMKMDGSKPKTILVGAIVMLIIVIAGNRLITLVQDLNLFGKFTLFGMETERKQMWKYYLMSLFSDFSHFMTGGNPTNYRTDGNLHNFLLQMVAIFGPAFFVVTMILLLKSFFYFFKEKRYDFLIVTTGFLVRAFTDKIMFRNYFELFFYFFIMYYYVKRKKLVQDNLVIPK